MTKRKVDEIVGDYTAAKLKNMFTLGPTRSAVDVAAQNIFTKEIVGRITAYLDNGIKTGLIDPSLKTQSPGTPAAASPAVANQTQPATSGTATTAPSSNPPNPGTPEYFAAQRQQKQAQAAKVAQSSMVPVTKQVTAPTTQTPAPGSPEYFAAKRKAAANIAQSSMVPKPTTTPKTNILPSPSQQNPYTDRILKNINVPKNITREDKFFKLNELFENIVNLSEAESISSALEKYVYQVANINPTQLRQEYKQAITDKIEKIEKSYEMDRGVSELKNLALIIYQIRSLGTAAADQAQASVSSPTMQQTTQTTQSTQPSQQNPSNQTAVNPTTPATPVPAVQQQAPLLSNKEILDIIPKLKTGSLKSLYKHLTGQDFVPT